jgi:4-amino-4-deoxy-L-arabinose transferase-like glycosyltransferase
VPVSVLGAWLLAGEVLGRRRLLQTAAAAVPALAPMFTFISASVSPDGMLYAVWTLALWLGVRAVKRGVPLLDGAAFFALVGLACTVKATSYALLVPTAFVAVLGLLARRPWRLGGLLRFAVAAAVPMALTLGAWVVVARATDHSAAAQVSAAAVAGTPAGGGSAGQGGTNWREFASYLWQ